MLTKFQIVLSAALVLGTASAALAADKHKQNKPPVSHPERTVSGNVVAPGFAYPGRSAYPGYNGYRGYNAFAASNAYPGYDAYAFERQAANRAYDYYSNASRGETYIWIQDEFFRDSN